MKEGAFLNAVFFGHFADKLSHPKSCKDILPIFYIFIDFSVRLFISFCQYFIYVRNLFTFESCCDIVCNDYDSDVLSFFIGAYDYEGKYF